MSPVSIIGGTLRADGGLAAPSPTGGGAASRTGGIRGGRASIGKAVSGLGAFGTGFEAGGLNGALEALGLQELRGKSAAEVVARVAEHLAAGVEGRQGQLLIAALRETIFEVADFVGDPNYENLEASLQEFLDNQGVEGLLETFLTRFVFDRVWSILESHAQEKSDSSSTQAMAYAVEGACRAHVIDLFDVLKEEERFEQVDWFGQEGQRLGEEITEELEKRLLRLEEAT